MIKLAHLLTEGMGDCYQASGRLIMNFFGDKNHKLVHGMVNGQGALKGKRYGHAWVESNNTVLDHSNGKKLEVPTNVYYALGRIKRNQCKYYTPEQAAKFMVDKAHWGPWEMVGGVVMAEEIPDVKGEIGKRRVGIPSSFLKNIDLDESIVTEAFKKDGHVYNHVMVGDKKDNALAGKDGILGSNGVFISWEDVRMLQRKYRGRQ
jgi:hypothetical protein